MKINALEMGTKKSSQVIPVINDLIKEIEDLKEIIKDHMDYTGYFEDHGIALRENMWEHNDKKIKVVV
jgi:hypothetical protein